MTEPFEPLKFRFHPSSIGRLMSDAQAMDVAIMTPDELEIWRKKSRTPDEQARMDLCRTRSLSEGAKEYLTDMAKEVLYGSRKLLDTREIDKGLRLEDSAIEFYNRLFFTDYAKNTERRKDDYLTGECDVYDPGVMTLDTKVSWCVDSFPVLATQAHNVMYEWQGRAYMRLWNTSKHRVAYVLLSTPDDLLRGYEQADQHQVDHIDPKLRCTYVDYTRDEALEQKMIIKLQAAQKYLAEVTTRIRAEHGIIADWRKKVLHPTGA